jgi:hypothetical protein
MKNVTVFCTPKRKLERPIKIAAAPSNPTLQRNRTFAIWPISLRSKFEASVPEKSGANLDDTFTRGGWHSGDFKLEELASSSLSGLSQRDRA